MDNTWHPIPGWEGLYEVTRTGRVRSLERVVESTMGRRYKRTGSELKPRTNGGQHLWVSLVRNKRKEKGYIHRILAKVFIPNPDNLPVVRHLNDDPLDNRIENLAWGTQRDNMQDRIRNFGHPNSLKTHCPQGHEYNPENTALSPSGGRACRTCRDVRVKKHHEKYANTEPREHGTVNAYKVNRCRCEPCKKANTDYCREARARRQERDRLTKTKEEQ